MRSKKMASGGGSRDLVSGLPDALRCHILSFLPTKEAASTSVLSKKWKNLLAFVPNLEFDDSIYLHPGNWKQRSKCFMNFVERMLALQANAPLNKFYLKCNNVDPYWVLEYWIPKVVKRGVSDLDIRILDCYDWKQSGYYPVPSETFVSNRLVRLKIGVKNGAICVEDDVSLPKLKTLHLDHVYIENSSFAKLLSGCPELEELVLNDLMWDFEEPFSVSIPTAKRLKFCRSDDDDFDEYSESMSFDTPSLVSLEYSDTIAEKYPLVSFDSLVEASLGLRMTTDQMETVRYKIADDIDAKTNRKMLFGHVAVLLTGIRNVKILYLSNDTLEVLNYCCETMPVFDNLIHLTFNTRTDFGWELLSPLLKNCPNLETLAFEGLNRELTDTCSRGTCGYVCHCEYYGDENEITSLLSSSPVKILKILKFGEICDDDDDMEEQIRQVKHFLETMPNLEKIVLYCDTPTEDNVIKVSSQLQILPKVASSKCKIQVISDNPLPHSD